MKRVGAILLWAWLAAVAVPAQIVPEGPDQTGAILKELARITGWGVIKPVPQETISRDKLREFFNQRIKEEVKPEEIRIEEVTLKKFGLVPSDFNLERTTVDLMTEQAAAFYDYRKKKMVMLESSSGGDAMQQVALVHELAHALADQHFNLEKYLKKSEANDDGTLARTAVMEGQATWLMSEYMAQRMGQSLRDSPMLVEMMSRAASGGSGGGFPVLESVPLYMRESLIFPYVQGMLFQQKVVMKLGQPGFSEVFRNPPATSQEILHPEKYFAHQPPVNVKPPALPSDKGWKTIGDGTVGEFDHLILLRQYVKDEESLAASWRGGQYRLWENKDGKNTVLAYASAWENPESARRMFESWQKVQTGKWKTREVTQTSQGRVTGRGDDGYFVLRLDGTQFSCLEGLTSPAGAQ